MNTVICVLASKPAALNGLLRVLGDRFPLIIHLDSKVGNPDIKPPRIGHIVEERLPVYWGGFNMCLAMVRMIDEAYRLTPDFRRLVMITGDTLPSAPLDALTRELADETKEYIRLVELPNDPSLRGVGMDEAVQRYGSVHAWRFQNFIFSDHEFHCPRALDQTMKQYGLSEDKAHHVRGTAHRIVQGILKEMPQRPPLYEKFFSGASWWALSRPAVDLIVDDIHSPIHQEFFRYLNVPDEHFFQTILGNKMRALASMKRVLAGPLVYVDYSSPARAEFKGRDFLSLSGFSEVYAKHQRLFARKYDPEQSPDIARAIEAGTYFGDVVAS